jgi:hypothetical protein
MGRELGRISGPLLADNLKRNGNNLAFETRLLYLNVTGTRIGVNTLAPAYELDVNDSFRTIDLNVATQATLANLELYTNNIQNVVGNIVISPNQTSNPNIVVPQLQATNLLFSGNTLSNTVADADINIGLAVGGTTAQIKLNNNTLVSADLHATGDITFDGNITLGDNRAQDTVFFGSQISSDIVPDATTYNLGNNTTPLKWATIYVNTLATTVTGVVDVASTNLTGSGTNLLNGNVIIGANSANTLTVTASIVTNLTPSVTNTYSLGSATGPKHWNNIYGVTFDNSNTTVSGNTIQTNTGNSDLQLVANSIGRVIFSKLSVTNNATVGGTIGVTGASTLTNTTIGAITQTGNYDLTGDTDITGNLSSVNITQIGDVVVTDFLIEDGTGLLQEDNSTALLLEYVSLQLPGVTIFGNNIDGTISNANLQITANGSSKILIPADDAQFDQNLTVGNTLTVTGTSTLTNTTVGAVTLTGDYNQTGNFVTTGSVSSGSITAPNPLSLPNITIDGTVITGTVADTPLTLTPYLGKVVQITRSALVDQNLTVGQTLSVVDTTSLTNTSTGAISLTGDYNQTGNFVTAGTISSGSITATNPFVLPGLTFDTSTITGTLSSSDLILTPKAGQKVKITSSGKVNGDLSVGQALTVANTSTLTNTSTGAIALVGDYNQTGNFVTTGSISSASITAKNPLTLPTLTLNGSVITGTANSNLTLTPNTTQLVQITSSAKVNQNLDVGGTFTAVGTSTLTDTSATTVSLAGDYNQTGNFVTAGTISSGSITAANPLVLPAVTIDGTTITGTNTNTSLTFTAKAGQQVKITSNATIDQNLNVGGTLTIADTSTLTNTSTGAITQTGDYNLTGDASITGNKSGVNITIIDDVTNIPDFLLEDNTNLLQEDDLIFLSLETISSAYLQLPNITISSSTISGTANNTDLRFTANGTGKVIIPADNVQIDQNLNVGGTFTETNTVNFNNLSVGTVTQTGDYNLLGNGSITGDVSSGDITATGSGSVLDIGNFRISGQTITGTVTDGSIAFQGNNLGSVSIGGYLKISDNRLINNWINISEPYLSEDLQIFVAEDNQSLYTELGSPSDIQSSIVLTPTGAGNVIVNSNKSIQLPSANDSNALLTDNGDIRFNDINNNIEAFTNTGYISFFNLYSQNYATYATPELTPNASDNLLRFGINGVVKATISDSKLFSDTLHAGNVKISGTTISNLVNSNNLILSPNGTGAVKVNNISLKTDQITNNTNSALVFASTGTGYSKITGTNGVVIPQGTTVQRANTPELGETRFNTTLNYLEVYDGTRWAAASGASSAATLDEIQAELDLWSLVLG